MPLFFSFAPKTTMANDNTLTANDDDHDGFPLRKPLMINFFFYTFFCKNYLFSLINGRLISDNILLADEMLYGYGRKRTSKRRCLSIGLRKAYDFSPHLCKLVWNCISTTSFSVLVKGTPIPPFKNHKGIRHGASLSPILFDIVMDVLRLVEREVEVKRIYL